MPKNNKLTASEMFTLAIKEFNDKPSVDGAQDALDAAIAFQHERATNEVTLTNRKQAMVKEAVISELRVAMFDEIEA